MPENESAESQDSVLILKAPYSEMSRFDKTGRLKELTKAAEPVKSVETNNVKRFVASTFGIFFIMVGMIGLFGKDQLLISVVCIFFGILVTFTFIAKPEMQKRRENAARKNPGGTEVSMIFSKHYIVMSSPHSELKKEWSELNTGTKKASISILPMGSGSTQKNEERHPFQFRRRDRRRPVLPLIAFYGDELKNPDNTPEMTKVSLNTYNRFYL